MKRRSSFFPYYLLALVVLISSVSCSKISSFQKSVLTASTLSVASGANHACRVLSSSALQCWGDNTYGELGNGSTVSTPNPQTIFDLGVSQIVASEVSTCALMQTGAVNCWGTLPTGLQLTPKTIIGQGVSQISVSMTTGFTCVVTTAGALQCWGTTFYGQFADGVQQETILTPTTVIQSGVKQVAAGDGYICAVLTSGALQCWGENDGGELGDGTTTNQLYPETIISSGISQVGVGGSYGQSAQTYYTFYDHTCALATSGAVSCWGDNEYGDVSANASQPQLTPFPIIATGATSISVGTTHSCAVLSNGDLQCWGSDLQGELGDGTEDTTGIPVTPFSPYPLPSGSSSPSSYPSQSASSSSAIAQVSAGDSFTCAVTQTGQTYCWGSDANGQLGGGITAYAGSLASPTMIVPNQVAQISNAADMHSCIVTTSGALQCWGTNSSGQLGDGTTHFGFNHVTPFSSGVAQVATGVNATCAITSGGALYCWGNNGNGVVAKNTTPIYTSGVKQVALDQWQGAVCALMNSGALYCWGNNASGEVGNGDTTGAFVSTPYEVYSGGVSSVTMGTAHVCAVLATGEMDCWGDNVNYQLGTTTITNSFSPILVVGSSVTQASAGYGYTCAILSNGTMGCLGGDAFTQFGNGTQITQASSFTANSETGVLSISASSSSSYGPNIGYPWGTTCIITAGGALSCAGLNYYGVTGIGNSAAGDATTFLATSIASGATQVTVQNYTGCVLLNTGELDCWGEGPFGNGWDSSGDHPNPMLVP